MKIFDSVYEMEDAVGEELGVSNWVEIDQKRIDQFAEATNDYQWIHIEPDRAAKTPFGGTIAHGFLVLSLASSFCYEAYTVNGLAMGVNYGLDKVRFISPVPVNSKIRGRVVLKDFKRLSDGVKMPVTITVELEGGSKPASIIEMIGLLYEEKNS